MASKGQQDHDQPKEANTQSINDSYAPIIRSLQRSRRLPSLDLRTQPKTEEGNAVRARLRGLVMGAPVGMKNTYRHEPIDYGNEIRILKIFPGSSDDKLECILFPRKLGQVNSESRREGYWALSYWWGDEMEVASNKITIYHE